MAFTSSKLFAGSSGPHEVEIKAHNYYVRRIKLFGRRERNKGLLWKINFSNFLFPRKCTTLKDIQKVYITARSNDGWNIDSIVTMVKDTWGKSAILTQNLDALRWIDGNSFVSSKRFELTMA